MAAEGTTSCIDKNCSDILQEINDLELVRVRDLFKANWPYAMHIYYIIDNYMKWKSFKPNLKVKFYCPESRSRDDATIVIIIEEYMFSIVVFTYEKNCEQLSRALRETSLIDWSRGPLLYAVHEDHVPYVREALCTKQIKLMHDMLCGNWWLPKEKALDFDTSCPSDLYISPIHESHAERIASEWRLKMENAKEYLEQIIHYNGGVGLFNKRSDKLLSWILEIDWGITGNLQTAKEHKGKGYAKIILKALSKEMARKGMDIGAFIFDGNKPSEKLYTSLGFTKISKIYVLFVDDLTNPKTIEDLFDLKV